MIKRVITRLIKEYQNSGSFTFEQIKGSPALFECLNILEEVS